MPSDQELHNTVNKITNTASLFSMTGYSPKQSPYKDPYELEGIEYCCPNCAYNKDEK